MITYDKFAPLYDFTPIEIAVQKFFLATAPAVFVQPPDNSDDSREKWIPESGTVAFFTNFENLVFKAARPRVSVMLNGVSPIAPIRRYIDANDQMQIEWWRGRLTFQVITGSDYAFHMVLRATVLALGAQLCPPSGDSVSFPIGMNAYLDNHEATGCDPSDISTGVHIESGYYLSPITYNFDFAVKPSAWPAT